MRAGPGRAPGWLLVAQDGEHPPHLAQGLTPGVPDAEHRGGGPLGVGGGGRGGAVGDHHHDPQAVGDDVVDLARDPGALLPLQDSAARPLLAQPVLGGVDQGGQAVAARAAKGPRGPGPGHGDHDQPGKAESAVAHSDGRGEGDRDPGHDEGGGRQGDRPPAGVREVVDHEPQQEVDGEEPAEGGGEQLGPGEKEHDREGRQGAASPEEVGEGQARAERLQQPRDRAPRGHGQDELVVGQD